MLNDPAQTTSEKPDPSSGSLDPALIRADFPILDQQVNGRPLIYFDNAATTQKPHAVIDALNNYYLRDNSNVHRGMHELSTRATVGYESARKRVARYFNAPSRESVIFTRGTTEAINLAANAWAAANLKPGDRILLTEMEHHSNIVPWQLLAARMNLTIAWLPVTGSGELDLAALPALLRPPTRLFAFTHISNTLGTINPAGEMIAAARAEGVVTLLDAAQSCGHAPVDMTALGCDFLAFSGHKMCGPTAIGALIGRPERMEEMQPWQGGGEMIETVTFDGSTWKSGPHKFEAGTPAIAEAFGLAAACDYIDKVGRVEIRAHDRELGALAWEQISALDGVRVLGPEANRGGVVSFVMEDVHSHDVVEVANTHGLALRGGHHCNQPLMRKLGTPSTARASFYFYNTKEEVESAVEILRRVRDFFASGS